MVEVAGAPVKAKDVRGLGLSLIVFLVIGAAIAWSTSILAMTRFYASEGTLVRFNNIGVTNPLITPCFWGAVAFLVCLGSAGYLYSRIPQGAPLSGYNSLSWLLVACVLFGAGNVAYESWRLNSSPTGSIIGCTAEPMTSIFQSPCVYGTLMYLASMITAFVIARKVKTA